MLKRTTLPLNHPLQDAPVIGRNIFELAAMPEDVKEDYLPHGLSLRISGTETMPMLNISIHGTNVGYLRRHHVEDLVRGILLSDVLSVTLQNGANFSIDNVEDRAFVGYVAAKDTCYMEIAWGSDIERYNIESVTNMLEERCPDGIYALVNAMHDLQQSMEGCVTLIDGISVLGPVVPDQRLLKLLADIDAKLEAPKVEAELERQGFVTDLVAEKRAAELAAEKAEADRLAREEAERARAHDNFFSM